jgi:hypothetical protein
MLAMGSDNEQVPQALIDECLASGLPLQVKTSGYSMWPFVRDGMTVTVKPCSSDECHIGDIVLVRILDSFLLHRVVGRKGSGLLTKGDARRRVDGLIPPKRVLGRVSRRMEDPFLGRVSPIIGPPLWIVANIYRQFFDRDRCPL